MNTFTTTASLLTHSLAWALLYSLWQGLLIYATLFVILKALPNINARVKYYISLSAFAGLFLWFTDTWAEQFQKLKGVTVYISQTAADAGVGSTYTVKTFTGPDAQTPLHNMLPRLEPHLPLLLVLYTAGLAFMLLRFLVNILQVRALRTQGLMPLAPKYLDLLSACREKLNITRPVAIYLSGRITVPMMLSVVKPMILLPVATLNHLSIEQLEAIISHELAHIRRHDYLVNLLQTIAETILFFNPFVWLISRIIRKEREHCCDDMVVANSADPLPYAKALAIIEGNRYYSNKLTIAATGNKHQLFHRIKRIMEMKKTNINYSQLTIILAAIIAITFTAAMFTFTPSFAQKAKKTEKSDTTKKSVYKYKTVRIDKDGNRTEEERVSDKPMSNKMDDGGDEVIVSYKDGDSTKKVRKIIINNKTVNINGDEIEREVHNAMNEVDKELSKVDWDEINMEIEKGLDEIKKELADGKLQKEISIEIKKEMEHAKESIEKAKKEMKKVRIVREDNYGHDHGFGSSETLPGTNDYETMLKQMEKDGLLDRSKGYKVEKENEALTINGSKQSAEVYNKYLPYLKDKTVKIKGSKGSLNITIND
jgi:bla regulator protein blaR1